MRFELTDFGKVAHADIRLDGMTVIAGKNATGKSTISRAAMAYFTLLRRMDSQIHAQRIKSIEVFLSNKLMANEQTRWLLRTLFSWSAVSSDDMLARDFWSDSSCLWALLKRMVPERDFSVPEASLAKLETFINVHFQEIQKGVYEILDRPDTEYMELIFRTKFNQIFKRQIISLNKADAEAVLTVEYQEGKVQTLSFKGDGLPRYPKECWSLFDSILYLEPVNILDALDDDFSRRNLSNRYYAGDKRWSQILKLERYSNDISLEQDHRITKAQHVLAKIGNILHGKLVTVNDDIKFKEDGIETPIELMNLASGIKSMAMLFKAVGNGSLQEGDLLIVDEPESNLHPEWQVRFAEFLVLLQKELGIKILLNTHSFYFLKAIEVYTRRYEVCQDTHYYFMRAEEGEGGVCDEISDDLTVAYDALYRPLEAMMEE